MNTKFFDLPEEKQKKALMSEIAGAANISKSLLFHYFQNKKTLYLSEGYIQRNLERLFADSNSILEGTIVMMDNLKRNYYEEAK